MEEKDTGEIVLELMKAIDKLPGEAQFAIYLAIKNIGIIRELCKNPEATREELKGYRERYKAENEYMGQILSGLALSYMDEGAD